MAIIYSYPQIGELATGDTIVISDASNGNKTKSVTVGQLDSYINTGQATIIQVDDRVVTGASFNTNDGELTLTRNGGDIPSVTTSLDGRYALTSSLATVATSGSYNDLSDQPTIPAAYTDADVDAHLNKTGQTQDNYVLSLSNNDYTWVAQSGGGGGIGGSGTDTQMAIFDSTSTITSTQAVAVNSSSQVIMEVLANSTSYVDDAAASADGVPFAGLYRDGSNVKICLINPGGGEFDPDPFIPTADGTPAFLAAVNTQGYLVDKTGAQVTPPNGNITYPFNISNGGFLVSDDLQYIYAYPLNPRTVYKSGDYGQSFQNLGFAIGTNQAYLARAISKNGQYVYIQTDETASGIRFSSDYGNSFSQLSITGVTGTFQCTVKTSSGGKFVWITLSNINGSPNDVRILKSFNYGSSFIDVTSLIPQPTITSQNRSIGLSGDGRIVTIYQRDGSSNSSLVYRSLDYGQTFTLLNANNILPLTGTGIQTNQDGSVVAFQATGGQLLSVNSYNADQTPINYFTLAGSLLDVGLSNYGSYGFWANTSNGSFDYFEQGSVNTNVQLFNNNLRVFNTVNL